MSRYTINNKINGNINIKLFNSFMKYLFPKNNYITPLQN